MSSSIKNSNIVSIVSYRVVSLYCCSCETSSDETPLEVPFEFPSLYSVSSVDRVIIHV